MSIPLSHRLAVSPLRIDARVLSTSASASGSRVQIESADRSDAAVHRLWISGIHQERDHRQAASSGFHPAGLSLGVAGVAAFLLGLSQHALVSVRLLTISLFDSFP